MDFFSTAKQPLKYILLCGLVTLTTACVNKDTDAPAAQEPGDTANEFNFTGMLVNYADNLIIPQLELFSTESQQYASSTASLSLYCDAIGSAQEADALTQAQNAWHALMARWQYIEALQIGPITDNASFIRNTIHSYGSSSPHNSCGVDQSVVLAEADGFDITLRSFNSRGLDALEYLLFNTDLTHTCPSQITETNNWNSRTEQDKKSARCAYAQHIADDIAQQASSLHHAWVDDGGNYRSIVINPNNTADNLKALSDALFYLELDVKDRKLGVSTGIHANCSQDACPEAIESAYSEASLMNIRQNLVAFRDGLIGGTGLGFDDMIISEGYPEVVDSFNTHIENALASIDTMTSSLSTQVDDIALNGRTDCDNSAANPDSTQTVPACSLHGLIKRITDTLRIDFITIVDIDLPDRAQSDND